MSAMTAVTVAAQARFSHVQGALPIIAPKPPALAFAGPIAQPYGGPYPSPPRPPPVPGPSAVDLPPSLYPAPQQTFDIPNGFGLNHPVMPSLPSPPYPPPGQNLQQPIQPEFSLSHQLPPEAYLGQLDGMASNSPIRPSTFVPVSMEEATDLFADDGELVARPAAEHRTTEEDFWFDDDEASMIDSDDDYDVAEGDAINLETSQLAPMGAGYPGRSDHRAAGTRLRTPLLECGSGILDSYYPRAGNSPLNDSKVAAVFRHFINVTAPSMSLYERHPLDPVPFSPEEMPFSKSRKHIWTCRFLHTFPWSPWSCTIIRC